jgi:hypothetical protein
MYPSERASQAYQRGYRDCRDNRPKLFERDGTFQGYDYDEGWWACWNEQYWNAVAENRRSKTFTDFLWKAK